MAKGRQSWHFLYCKGRQKRGGGMICLKSETKKKRMVLRGAAVKFELSEK